MCPFSRSSLFQNLVDVQSCVGAKELLVTSEFGFARECDIEQVFEVLVAEIFDGDRATVWDDMVSHVLRILTLQLWTDRLGSSSLTHSSR